LAITVLAVLVAAGSLVVRFRRARGSERQQLRWVALAAVLTAVGAAIGVALALAGNRILVDWVAGGCVTLLPLAVGAAVLRYRLYDLDRIISRTLTYGLLTVLLGGGYAGVVLGSGQFLNRDSPLIVAGATLAEAAVFQPAHRRVQQVVDRRFNRRRYDAAQTIAGFSARLRQQTDLDTLTAELLNVVEQTMQPTQASLWLRPLHALSSAAGGPAAHQ
jgi:ABC-type Co2+ transport system permease subunit